MMGFYLAKAMDAQENISAYEQNMAKMFSLVTAVTILVMNVYECIQIIALGFVAYFRDPLNWLDLAAQIAAQVTSLWNLSFGVSVTLRNMYVITILLQTTKFYLNLKAVDFIRALSNKIFGITRRILPFFIIVVIFLLCFTNIFYVSELFYGTTTSWPGYLMQTYYIFFAAWATPTPRTTDMDWVISLWILFTVVFTIVIFNVLIALVTEAYEELVSDNIRIDNQTKLAMIIETV